MTILQEAHVQMLITRQDRPTPCDSRRQYRFLLQHRLQVMDPEQPVDALAFIVCLYWIHAPDLLEAKVLPYKSLVSRSIHCV
jgi:hypothetical protein